MKAFSLWPRFYNEVQSNSEMVYFLFFFVVVFLFCFFLKICIGSTVPLKHLIVLP